MNNRSKNVIDVHNLFNKGGSYGVVYANINKKTLGKWKTDDKKEIRVIPEGYNLSNAHRIGTAYNNGNNGFTILDWDELNEYNIKTIKAYLDIYNGKIIAYPTKKGFHMWFKTPENLRDLDFFKKRQQKFTTMLGNTTLDYLPNGIIYFGSMSSKTNKIELFQDTNNFNLSDFSDACALIINSGEYKAFNSLKISPESINDLAELPKELLPLGLTSKGSVEKDNFTLITSLDLEPGSRNVSLTKWVNKLLFKNNDKVDMHDEIPYIKDFINENYFDEPLSIEELNNITEYDNRDHTNSIYLDKKEKKVRKAATANKVNYQDYDIDKGNLAKIDKTNYNEVVDWCIDNLEIKLLDNTILIFKKNKWYSEPEHVYGEILRGKYADHYTISQVANIYKTLVIQMVNLINDGNYELKANINNRPLWVDKNYKMIDPYDAFNEDGSYKIQDDIANGIVLHTMDIDFTNLAQPTPRIKTRINNYLFKPLLSDKVRISHMLRYVGYFLMSGRKFRKKVLLPYSEEANSGKSKFLNMIGAYYDGRHISRAKISDLGGTHGLQGVMNKVLNIGDDINGTRSFNSEHIKNISSEMFAMVNPKGLPQTSAYMPKLIFSTNMLPAPKVSDQGWLERMEIIHWEKNYTNRDNNIEENIVERDFREVVFRIILNQFKNINKYDDEEKFWENPYQDIMNVYINDLLSMEEQTFKDIMIELGDEGIIGKKISEIFYQAELESGGRFFRRDLSAKKAGTILKSLGYEPKHTKHGNVWIKKEEQNV